MSRQQHSGSLQIVQNNHQLIQITQNSFQIQRQICNHFFQPQKIDDTFDLSLDQNSLSFHIEQLKQQSTCNNVLKEGSINSQIIPADFKKQNLQKQQKKPTPVVQQQRKKKRKQIFQKYKNKPTQNLIAETIFNQSNNNLIKTIDQIFQTAQTQNIIKAESKNFTSLKKQSQSKANTQQIAFKKKQSNFQVASTSFQQLATIVSPRKQMRIQQPLVCQTASKYSVGQFQIPSNISGYNRIDSKQNLVIGSTNSFIVDSDINRISMIQPLEQQASRDSGDLQTFLKSQIFRGDNFDKTILKNDTSYKNIQISMVNPSIMINQTYESPKYNNMQIQQRLGLVRDKSQAVLPAFDTNNTLKKNLSQRKFKIFQTIHIKPQNIVKEKVKAYEQNRIPLYLRQIRRKNTIIPNFHLRRKNREFYESENLALKELLMQFRKGLSFLDFINQLVYERHTLLTSSQKILLNSLTIETFLTCGWQKKYEIKQLYKLQPHQNFNKRPYDYQKVKQALNNYIQIVQYYQKCNLNLEDPKAQKKYFQIRSKFWQIEKNIKMIGQDIYLLATKQIFPYHYYEFLKVLRGEYPKFEKPYKLFDYIRNLLAKYNFLRNQGDIICISQIGKNLKLKLQKMIQKSNMI